MHHPQAERYGVMRRLDLSLRAVDPNLPLVGGVEAVEDLHDSRLARAVFADNGVNSVGGNREVDAFVRGHRAEALGDSPHFNNVLIHNIIRHSFSSPKIYQQGAFLNRERLRHSRQQGTIRDPRDDATESFALPSLSSQVFTLCVSVNLCGNYLFRQLIAHSSSPDPGVGHFDFACDDVETSLFDFFNYQSRNQMSVVTVNRVADAVVLQP